MLKSLDSVAARGGTADLGREPHGMADSFRAFCPDGVFELPGAATGPLAGITFAVKDVIDIAGRPTSAGNPDWLRTHPVPQRTAPCVQRLLDAGARFVGKTITDEICCSMSGINVHYGTPLNSAAPERLPGGSSSGSAAVVAGGGADLALGTDTSGSVRLPASYCGIFGFRPTHGRISTEGVMPLAPTFDTVGLMARDARLLERAAQAILSAAPAGWDGKARHLLVATDAYSFAEPYVQEALLPLVRALRPHFESVRGVEIYGPDPLACLRAHLALVDAEFHEVHQAWIDEVEPAFGPDVGGRMEVGATGPEPDVVEEARRVRAELRERMQSVLVADTVLLMPTVHCIAPLVDTPLEDLSQTEVRSMILSCISSLAGTPQVTAPWARAHDAPVGLSLLGPRDGDEGLLALVSRLDDLLRG